MLDGQIFIPHSEDVGDKERAGGTALSWWVRRADEVPALFVPAPKQLSSPQIRGKRRKAGAR